MAPFYCETYPPGRKKAFYNYEYCLDVSKQYNLINDTISLEDGLCECFDWYKGHSDQVAKKAYIDYIDINFSCTK